VAAGRVTIALSPPCHPTKFGKPNDGLADAPESLAQRQVRSRLPGRHGRPTEFESHNYDFSRISDSNDRRYCLLAIGDHQTRKQRDLRRREEDCVLRRGPPGPFGDGAGVFERQSGHGEGACGVAGVVVGWDREPRAVPFAWNSRTRGAPRRANRSKTARNENSLNSLVNSCVPAQALAEESKRLAELGLVWWGVQVSNLRHPACKAGALPLS
jgi:hypothetical protein